MIRKISTAVILALGLISAHAADPYKVQAPVPADFDGAMAFIINFDTGEKVDSTLVEGATAVFSGTMDEPFAARMIVDGARYSQFILEPGSIAIDAATRRAFGSPLNDQFGEINRAVSELSSLYARAETDSARQAVVERYDSLCDSLIAENADNPIGYMLFLQQAYDYEPDELVAFLEANPSFRNYKRLQKLVEMNERRAATAEGSQFIDFDINGTKLSDFVGRDGKYLLVDYFASWCGPCKVQIEVLKEIYQKYKDSDKLDILGVAVWDEPDDTRRAIESEQIPWEVIINAQSIPTDLYGISGIPSIMLIAPDGTIVSRDKMSDDLKADVDRFLSK